MNSMRLEVIMGALVLIIAVIGYNVVQYEREVTIRAACLGPDHSPVTCDALLRKIAP